MKRMALACVFIVASGALAQPVDPEVGVWKLNKEKSRVSTHSITLTVQVDGKGLRNTAEGLSGGGRPFKIEFTAYYDGQDWPVHGYSIVNRASFRRIDARTTERTDKFNDRVVQTARRVVSEDGRTMTTTHSPSGDFFFYEKQ